MLQIGKILGDREDQDELDPFRGLKMVPAGQFHPASCAQILLSENEHRHQRCQGNDVHPVHPLKQSMVVQQADDEHADQTARNPVHLLDMDAGEFRVQRGTANLDDAERADNQHERDQRPIKIAE